MLHGVLSSDSSMVDEYPECSGARGVINSVQIPLWSMNTLWGLRVFFFFSCSDSSMVDEYFLVNFIIKPPQ